MSDKQTETYVLTSADIAAYDGIHKAHFLNPNAQRVNKSLGDLTGLTGFGFHLIEIAPGHESTELHCHYHEDECVYILEGQAEAIIGEDSFTVTAGDFIGYRAGGKAHKLVNNGNTTLKCIVVGQRLNHDVADYPALNKRIYRNNGLPWNLVNMDDITEPVAGKKV